MMTSRLRQLSLAAALLVGFLMLGYLWPVNQTDFAENSVDQWEWTAGDTHDAVRALPNNLARYWPGKKPLSSAEQAAASADTTARHDWMLIGIIRQGGPPSAVVLDPEGKLLTLSIGDRLDEQREITALRATTLIWQDAKGATGELQLYPEPATP
ncbi:hypothetical protein [Ectopseudomonas oleovorans]|uniref:hypothetical protein n=1 Tax=Ectopseudomonas oleovorans TaxID=301 RepID=UPI0035B07172